MSLNKITLDRDQRKKILLAHAADWAPKSRLTMEGWIRKVTGLKNVVVYHSSFSTQINFPDEQSAVEFKLKWL